MELVCKGASDQYQRGGEEVMHSMILSLHQPENVMALIYKALMSAERVENQLEARSGNKS